MRKEEILKRIAAKARADVKKRKDRRFLDVMGFLVAKGFLQTNYQITPRPNARIQLADAIWAGKNVEPRILEVLPAAVLRLEKHFDLDIEQQPELFKVLDALKRGAAEGPDFFYAPYPKVKAWLDLPLRDGRVKAGKDKRVPRTYRLRPAVIAALKSNARRLGCTETEYLERRVLG